MPKEAEIKRKFKKVAEQEGWSYWLPAKVKFYDNDIFTVFDAICWCSDCLLFVQLTTISNISARRKKIKAFLKGKKIFRDVKVQIWGWNKGVFKIVDL